MIYVIESIIFIAMTYIFNNIRNMKFYTWVLEHNKYTFDVWAQAKESFAYNVTKIVETMPTFSFAPTSWDYYQMRKEWYNTYNIGEKFLICIGMTLLAIRGIVGNVLIDLVFVITFLYERKVLRINSIINLVKEIDVGAIIESLVSFISENGNVILLIVFVSLAVYAMYERKKIATYQLEAIWGKDATNVKQVADRQKAIEDKLFCLRLKIYNNSCVLKQNIRFIEARKHTNDSYLISRYEDYTTEIEQIKKLLAEIWNIPYGITIYAKHNRKAFVQLRILELLLSDNIGHIELDECNKPALIKIDLTQSNSELKREFMIKWTHCISQVDGITRYLKYMNKKMMRYQRLITNVTDVKELKEIVENIKD